jgi:hypothetical protein
MRRQMKNLDYSELADRESTILSFGKGFSKKYYLFGPDKTDNFEEKNQNDDF